jgi:hypothetical protein
MPTLWHVVAQPNPIADMPVSKIREAFQHLMSVQEDFCTNGT